MNVNEYKILQKQICDLGLIWYIKNKTDFKQVPVRPLWHNSDSIQN